MTLSKPLLERRFFRLETSYTENGLDCKISVSKKFEHGAGGRLENTNILVGKLYMRKSMAKNAMKTKNMTFGSVLFKDI